MDYDTDIDDIGADFDGVLLTGGRDLDPRFYGEDKLDTTITAQFGSQRFELEKKLYSFAKSKSLPILGICLGMQTINVLEGGSLFQNIENSENHQGS